MAVSSVPIINGDDRIYVADGTETNSPPANTATNWTRIIDSVNAIPNFVPSREILEYNVLDKTQALSILGPRPAIDGTLDIYYVKSFVEAHKKMVTSQLDDAKGSCFWFRVDKKNEDRTFQIRCTIDDIIPNATSADDDLPLYSLQMTNIDEAVITSPMLTAPNGSGI